MSLTARAMSQAEYRQHLFQNLAGLELDHGGWDEMFRLLYRGQLAASHAELDQLAEQMQQGQQSILQALQQSGQFLDWELRQLHAGLAVGNIQAVFQRLAEHYLIQQQFYQDLRRALRLPFLLLLGFSVVLSVFAVNKGYTDITGGVVRSVAGMLLVALTVAGSIQCVQGLQQRILSRRSAVWLTSLPGVAQICRHFQAYHFFANFELAVKSGLGLSQSLKLAYKFLPLPQPAKMFRQLLDKVLAGNKFSTALIASDVLKGMTLLAGSNQTNTTEQAQEKLTAAAKLAYLDMLMLWSRLLPQFLYAFMPLLALLYLLSL